MRKVLVSVAIIGVSLGVAPTAAAARHLATYRPEPLPPVAHTKVAHLTTKICDTKPAGCAYPRWVRLFKYEEKVWWQAEWKRRNRSFDRALSFAAEHYGVSYYWLYECASHEGGHSIWKPNHEHSGAGGWMQFFPHTFFSYASHDQVARVIPHRYIDWYSPVGQAYTAAYMFDIGQDGQWEGQGCER